MAIPTTATSVKRALAGQMPSEHLITHMDSKPYKCNIRKYNCSLCRNSLSWADYIKTHIVRPWMLIPTIALYVERASAKRTTSKLILSAHGCWSLQLHNMWKELQLGGLHHNSCSPLRARRKAWLENTTFALSNFSRTGWGYTSSSGIYSAISDYQALM